MALSNPVCAAGVAYALADAFRKGAEGRASYLLLDLGIMVHEGMSLLLMPMAAPLFRREALLCVTCLVCDWCSRLSRLVVSHSPDAWPARCARQWPGYLKPLQFGLIHCPVV